MRDIDPTASEYITSGYLDRSQPGGVLYDVGSIVGGGLGFLVGGPAGAAVGAQLGGSVSGASAVKDAVNAQVDAANTASANSLAAARESNALQKEMFDKQIELQAPFREAGLTGQNRLLELLGLGSNTGAQGYGSANKDFSMADFEQDPGYKWQLEQDQRGIERSAAARGGLLSGRAAKDLINYTQGSASREYGNAYNRFQTNRANRLNPLQSLTGAAQTASGAMGNAAGQYGSNVGNTLTNTANQVGQNMMGAGNARASGYVGGANALNQGISGGINAYQNYNAMNKLFGGGSGGGSSGWYSDPTLIPMQAGGGY